MAAGAGAQGRQRAARRHARHPPSLDDRHCQFRHADQGRHEADGHKTVAMFMRYVHTEDKPVREAAELVANRRNHHGRAAACGGGGMNGRRHQQHRSQRPRRCWATFGH
jgi:hypothetical protein